MTLKRATSVAFFILLAAVAQVDSSFAQESVYRCGKHYTNDAAVAKSANCKLVERSAAVTIPAPPRYKSPERGASASVKTSPSSAKQAAAAPRSAEQQARDSDAKVVIASELKKTESQLADLRKQYEGVASTQDEARKQSLKQQIFRAEADAVSLRREMAR